MFYIFLFLFASAPRSLLQQKKQVAAIRMSAEPWRSAERLEYHSNF